jgi:hypothetical protein
VLTLLVAALLHVEGNLPEPIFVESVTDVDTSEAGELEVELTTAALSTAWSMSLEAEYRVTRRLGFKLEAGLEHDAVLTPEVMGGVSFALVHLDSVGLHAQAVVYGRWPLSSEELALLDPSAPATWFAAGLHAAWQWRWLALRAEVTGGVGGQVVHAPLRVNGALLLGDSMRFIGFEALSDFARAQPLTLAFEGQVGQLLDDDVRLRVCVAVPFEPRRGGSAGLVLWVLLGFD